MVSFTLGPLYPLARDACCVLGGRQGGFERCEEDKSALKVFGSKRIEAVAMKCEVAVRYECL